GIKERKRELKKKWKKFKEEQKEAKLKKDKTEQRLHAYAWKSTHMRATSTQVHA
ncbi:hypothetical protein PIB30_112148, partial [Stylosanthes scabra]|nr:hypothetical protein [Stylosanthes scabra]